MGYWFVCKLKFSLWIRSRIANLKIFKFNTIYEKVLQEKTKELMIDGEGVLRGVCVPRVNELIKNYSN